MKLTTHKDGRWMIQKPSLFVLVITLVVLAVLIAASAFACRMNWVLGTVITLISSFVTLFSLFMCPMRMKLENQQQKLYVKYLFRVKQYDLSAYILMPVQRKEVILSLRMFGSGGFFGFWGSFRSKRLGDYYCSVTNTDYLICLISRTRNQKYVFNLSKGIEMLST